MRKVMLIGSLAVLFVVCCVQYYLSFNLTFMSIPSLLLSLVWFVALCIALATSGPQALWLLLTIPLGIPLLTYLVWTAVEMSMNPP